MTFDGWLINAVKFMFKNAKTSVKVNEVGGRNFLVEVEVHQGSVLSLHHSYGSAVQKV